MGTRPSLNDLLIRFEKLIQPSPDLEQEEQRHQARVLAVCSLAVIAALCLLAPIWIISVPHFPRARSISVGLLAALIVTYRLSRSRYYSAGAAFMVMTIFVLVGMTLLTSPEPMIERMLALDVLAFAVLVSSVFLRKRSTLLVVISGLVIIGVFFFLPDVPFNFTFSYLAFFALTMSVGWVVIESLHQNRYRLVRSEESLRAALDASLAANEALKNSEANFRTLFDTIEDFLWVLDMDGNILEVNQTVLKRLGYSLAELVNQPVLFVHPEERRSEAARIVADMLQGKCRYCPVPVQTKARDLIPVETYITRGLWNGQPALFGVTKDISALKMSEEKFAAAFHANPALVGLSRIDTGEYVEVNHTFCERLGFAPEEVIGRKSTDLVRLDFAYREQVIEKLKNDGFVRDEEAVIYTRDGMPISVLLSAQILTLHGVPYNFTTAVDITERKRAEENLRASEAQQRALLSAIPDLVFRNRRDGTYLDYHASAPNELLVPPEEFIGRTIREVLPREFAEKHMHYVERVLETGREEVYEYTMSVHGSIIDYEARMVGCGSDEVITIVRNITKLKLAQRREFELALEKERHQLLASFIQNAAHEFRTPLATIGTSAYILTRSDDPLLRREKQAQIEAEIKRITRLIDLLLLMVKLENGESLKKEQVDINNLLEQLCSKVTATYKRSSSISCALQPELPKVVGHADYLAAAFKELLENAHRFNSPNSVIHIASRAAADHVQVEISDDGVGIAEDQLPHIFETFWRHDKSHSTPGFGLGLPIVRKIVQRHQGSIEVQSEPGKGTCFKIVLPVGDLLCGGCPSVISGKG